MRGDQKPPHPGKVGVRQHGYQKAALPTTPSWAMTREAEQLVSPALETDSLANSVTPSLVTLEK